MTKLFGPRADVFRRWEEAVAANIDAATADVYILTSAGCRYPSHSNILASISPVLESILLLPHGKSEKVIPILGVPCDAVLAFLNLLYAGRYSEKEGEEEIMKNYGMHLLVLSHVYQVKWLKRACEIGLAAELSTEVVVDVLQLARQCDAAWLCLRCLKLIGKDFAAVQKSEAWLFLQDNDPWLELDVLQFLHESELRKKQRRRNKEEQQTYLQLSEAMVCLLHIYNEGCTDVCPDRRRRGHCPSYAACKPLQHLLLHFAKCNGNRAICPRCHRIWQLLKLHSAVCMAQDSSTCKVPLCRQFRLRMQQMEGKLEERKWRILGKKVASVIVFSTLVKRKEGEK